jgi:flagellar biosynthesis/type III secretory pathway M-ring protein FliF/YscJ
LTDVTATTGSQLRLKVKVTDGDPEDSGNLRYSLTHYPNGMSIDENTGVIKWTPGSDQAGDRSVTVEVTDGIDTVSYTFSIDVKQGAAASLTWIPIMIGIVVLILIVGAILFLVMRKKGSEGEEKQKKDDGSDEIVAEMEAHRRGEESMDLHAPEVVHSDVPLSATEAHARDGRDRPKTYEDLYGIPAPKKEKGLTAAELKKEIGMMADQLEEMDVAE